ncbi:hypothetical protein BRC60_08125 [Halobacteriales archaeon QH_1_68_42]|nr:MAG: hypothetical protein BRC60_08125 [Halobacteriales archaeon QH_1_68_42]
MNTILTRRRTPPATRPSGPSPPSLTRRHPRPVGRRSRCRPRRDRSRRRSSRRPRGRRGGPGRMRRRSVACHRRSHRWSSGGCKRRR